MSQLSPPSAAIIRAETSLHEHNASISSPVVPASNEKLFHPVIELLYSTSFIALRYLERQYPNHAEAAQVIADRLELWGTGLFQGNMSVDQALSRKSKATDLLKNNVAGTLADVAVVLRKHFQ